MFTMLKILTENFKKFTNETKWKNFTFWWKLSFAYHVMNKKKCNFKLAMAASEWVTKNVLFWEDAKPENVANFYLNAGFKGTIFKDLML